MDFSPEDVPEIRGRYQKSFPFSYHWSAGSKLMFIVSFLLGVCNA